MLFLPVFVVRVYAIPSGSMETTLHGCHGCDNDRVVLDRLVYRFRDARPGEVVVFTSGPEAWPHEAEHFEGSDFLSRVLGSLGMESESAHLSGANFVKRVIAVGGQTVFCCDSGNRVMVDGVPIDEPYVHYGPNHGPATQAAFPEVKVPAGTMWVMGDNRNGSVDSREDGNGPVPVSALAGKVRIIIYPLSRGGPVDGTNPQRPH